MLIAFAAWLIVVLPCAAHEVRPALLQMTEPAPGRLEVTWKQPLVGDQGVRLIPHLSGGALETKPATETIQPGFLIRTWSVVGAAPLDGQTVQIEGLAQSVTDVIVKVDPRYFRPAEVETLLGDPGKAKADLGWIPQITLDEMIVEMVAHDLDRARRNALLKQHGYDVAVGKED